MATKQRTLVLIKPRGIQRGLVGAIIQRFENKGFRLLACKQVWCAEQRFEEHYIDLSDKSYFPKLVEYMSSGPVMSMIWEGTNAVKNIRALIGAPGDTLQAAMPGTIRGDFCTNVGHGPIIHASDSVNAAEREIPLWFNEKEIYKWPTEDFEFYSEIDKNTVNCRE